MHPPKQKNKEIFKKCSNPSEESTTLKTLAVGYKWFGLRQIAALLKAFWWKSNGETLNQTLTGSEAMCDSVTDMSLLCGLHAECKKQTPPTKGWLQKLKKATQWHDCACN